LPVGFEDGSRVSYEALARKYRPRTFEEVVGQEPIVRTLTNAIREKRIHHAYVFSGVRGVGKTTVARIFAKALNCEKGPTPTPCLVCDPCVEIAAGRDLDVTEMDAASRTGVDDVRDLIDTTRYAPARDRYRIFIIDEFHMLSKPAFNALLKTLEEPPARVVFVMATTELHKVLPTVLSRTQQFDFRKVPLPQITDQLEAIAKAEKVKAPRASLEMLARAGDGSVRDAESLLDQAIAFCGATLTEADVRSILGLAPEETVELFLSQAADRDAGALVRTIAEVLDQGIDLRLFHAGLIDGLRRLLLLQSVTNPAEILGLAPEDEKRLAALAARFDTTTLLRLFAILSTLEGPLRYSDQPRYLLEAAAIRMAALADLAPIEELVARLEEGAGGGSGGSRGPGGGGSGGAGEGAGAATGGGRPGGRSGASGPSHGGSGTGRAKPGPPRAGNATDSSAAAILEPHGGRAASGADASHDSSARPIPLAAGLHGDATDPAEKAGRPPAVFTGGAEDESGFASSGNGEDAPPQEDQEGSPDPSGSAGAGDSPIAVFLAEVREKKMQLAALLESAASLVLLNGCLTVAFGDSQAFARKSVEQVANVAILRQAAHRAIGSGATIRIVRADEISRADPAPAPASTTAGASGPPPSSGSRPSGPLPDRESPGPPHPTPEGPTTIAPPLRRASSRRPRPAPRTLQPRVVPRPSRWLPERSPPAPRKVAPGSSAFRPRRSRIPTFAG
jgi:DNA polymerase-3 subunit gamma/tau